MIARFILTPFSWVYGLVVSIRNLLYDKSILKSYHSRLPVIAVGNLLAGGTGKTPFVAWLAGELQANHRVTILSRGYGRRGSGLRLVHHSSSPDVVGDEPAELKMLLPEVTIVVDANRRRAIRAIESGTFGKTGIIILDDGFQHRQVTPGFSVVLDHFARPMHSEPLLPAGRRREPLSALKRAGLIVVTKENRDVEIPAGTTRAILVTGVADPDPIAEAVERKATLLHHYRFPDHHRYSRKEALMIRDFYFAMSRGSVLAPVILTTGKDFVKLTRLPELSDLPLQRIPAPLPFSPEKKKLILTTILDYVGKTERNR